MLDFNRVGQILDCDSGNCAAVFFSRENKTVKSWKNDNNDSSFQQRITHRCFSSLRKARRVIYRGTVCMCV